MPVRWTSAVDRAMMLREHPLMSVRTVLPSFLGLIAISSAQAPQPAPAKPVLQLRGDRFRGLTYEELTPAQKTLTDRALAARATIGTFNILLRNPDLSKAGLGTT